MQTKLDKWIEEFGVRSVEAVLKYYAPFDKRVVEMGEQLAEALKEYQKEVKEYDETFKELQHGGFVEMEGVKKGKVTWQGSKICDVCSTPVNAKGEWFADARIPSQGTWGLMCKDCALQLRVQFGTGKGQKYDSATMVKIEG